MTDKQPPKLVFAPSYGEQDARESESKGYCDRARAEYSDGSFIPLVFYDPVRLKEDVRLLSEGGRKFLGNPGLIVVKRVTQEYMERALEGVHRERFFDNLVRLPPGSRLDQRNTIASIPSDD
ncbi:MAG: hypothetical protein H6739_39685 [Alphaproteobacteria bacterium]|nr:hypothetical protein [Alphaproteobacteria bacterium]